MSLHPKAPVSVSAPGHRPGETPTGWRRLGAAEWLCLAAAPTFALMALLSPGVGDAEMLCSAVQDVSPLSGMTAMYALMSVFHLAPWLKLFSSRTTGRYRP